MSAETDISEFIHAIKDYQEQAQLAVANALHVVCEAIKTEAVRLCPLDQGDLAASAYVKPPKITKDGISCKIGFGMTYAAVVHENLEQPIRTEKNPSAQHKYLEQAMKNLRQWGLEYIANAIRNIRPGGGG